MFVNVDIWNYPYYKWGYWLWVLCSYFYWVIRVLMWSANYFFGMYSYVWWHIRDTVGGEEEGGLPCPFKNWKDWSNNRKNALIVFIHALNMFIYALISDAVSRVLRKKNCGAFFHVLWMKFLSKCPYFKKPSLPCKLPGRIPAYSFYLWHTNLLFSHACILPNRIL